MKNSGFTLIELLGVIAILGLLGVIIVPRIGAVISKNKQTLYETQIRNIKEAASNYISENIFKIEIQNNTSVGIKLGELKKCGYIDSNISNPLNSQQFSDDMIILITNKNNSYSYDVCLDDDCNNVSSFLSCN